MNTSTEKLLLDRLKEIDANIKALIVEKSKVKQAISIFRNVGPEVSSSLHDSEPTFKLKVRAALEKDFPSGATANQLLDYLNKNWKKQVKRESLSPQLSRLKNDDKIIDHDSQSGLWYLLKQEAPENNSEASSII
jgi:hypothetical protein